MAKKAGYMGIALLVLAVLPLVVAACVIPNIGPEVATKFNAAGEVTRWGKSYELLALPVLNLLLSVATYFTAGRQAKNNEDSAAMARIVCERYLRNGCITGVFLNVINVYFMYSAITGTGFWLWFLACPFQATSLHAYSMAAARPPLDRGLKTTSAAASFSYPAPRRQSAIPASKRRGRPRWLVAITTAWSRAQPCVRH